MPRETIGDALDTAADPCQYRYAWYSADRGEIGLMTKPCGAPSCPWCVAGWLTERVAPAWEYWAGEAVVAIVRGGHHGDREHARLGVRLRGADATPGVVTVARADGGRAIIAPAGSFDGIGVRGDRLDHRLRATLRALRFVERDPSADGGRLPGPSRIIPAWVTDEMITAAASRNGFSLNGRARFARTRGRTSDDFERFWTDLVGRPA